MSAYARRPADDPHESLDAGAMHKHAAPPVSTQQSRDALAESMALRARAEELAPKHRRSVRRRRLLRRAGRLLLVLLVLVAIAAVALLAPVDEWWADLRRASDGG